MTGRNNMIHDFRGFVINEDCSSEVWITSTSGLFYFDERHHCFRAFVNKEIPAFISGFYSESADRIWLVADSRLYLLNPKKNEVKTYFST